jgi:hypothetical protein
VANRQIGKPVVHRNVVRAVEETVRGRYALRQVVRFMPVIVAASPSTANNVTLPSQERLCPRVTWIYTFDILFLSRAEIPNINAIVPRFQPRIITVASRGWNIDKDDAVMAETANPPIKMTGVGCSTAV